MPAERIHLSGFLFGLLCAVMFGFAVGAVWMVPSMMFGRALPALVLPAGWILGVVVRRWLRFRGATGALLAAVATLIAAAYTACLVAAASISGMMGAPLIGYVSQQLGGDQMLGQAMAVVGAPFAALAAISFVFATRESVTERERRFAAAHQVSTQGI